ncbi:MAG: FAD-dependent oxidoreductase, partial [Candidatus Limnocylindria bacterium]
MRRLISTVVGLAIALPVPAAVAIAADDIPLTGTFDVTATGSTLEIGIDYRASGRISEFTVRVIGPGIDEVLFTSRDLENEVAWAWSADDLVPGAYAVTVSATVVQGQSQRSGTAQRRVTIGGPTRPPAPVGAIAGVAEPQAVEPAAPAAGDVSADVVVYGGTPSGVMAAISAARPGVRVVLIEASGHVGGMMSNGLTATDYGHLAMIGGRTRQFFDRTEAIEGSAYGRYRFQPSTAETAFDAMLASAGVEVMLDERLAGGQPIVMDGPWIEALRTDSGRMVSGGAFVDASYEGDLMAAAGVSYRIGRESIGEFGESYAGVRASSSVFGVPGGIDPHVPLSAPGAIGTGDNRIQNSNYRLCFSSDPKNQVPFYEPDGYDPETYDLAAAYIDSRVAQGHVPDITWFLWPVALPNNKFDVNNNGSVSIGLMGANTGYPDGSHATRSSIADALRDYTSGFLYFLGNDPRVPTSVRAQMADYGLCADEFADNGNWPRLLYLREGRRMVGRYLLTQRDVEVSRTKTDTIAVGSYAFDSHHVSRWIDGAGRLRVEGGFWSGRANAT